MGLRKKKCIKGDVAKECWFQLEEKKNYNRKTLKGGSQRFKVDLTLSSGGAYVEWGSNSFNLFFFYLQTSASTYCIASRRNIRDILPIVLFEGWPWQLVITSRCKWTQRSQTLMAEPACSDISIGIMSDARFDASALGLPAF